MNLYLIDQNDRRDYDTYDSAVVCAESMKEARAMHPNGKSYPDWDSGPYRSWALTPDLVTAKLIGKAAKGIAPGVICSSFNAG